MSRLNQVFRELVIRGIPFDVRLRRKALYEKYLSSVQLIGKNVIIKQDLNLVRRTAVSIGENVVISGGGKIDATAGLMIGSNTTIEKGVNISTVSKINGRISYDPIVIGSGQIVSSDLKPGTILKNNTPISELNQYQGQVVFILSTGRSGSKAISSLLKQHSDATCYHDPFPHMNTWSCDILYGRRKRKDIENRIRYLYNAISINKEKVHGISDQKLVPLINILAEIYPNSKFIWLIRDAGDFVNSAYARGWFDSSEFGYPKNKNEFLDKRVTPSNFDAAHRCNGYLVGEFSESEWKQMTAFERICWYWKYWNSLIEDQLSDLNSKRSIMIRLEELEQRKIDVLAFLNLEKQSDLKTEKINKAYYSKPCRSNWSDAMNDIFDKYCRDGMRKWYNA